MRTRNADSVEASGSTAVHWPAEQTAAEPERLPLVAGEVADQLERVRILAEGQPGVPELRALADQLREVGLALGALLVAEGTASLDADAASLAVDAASLAAAPS